MGLVPEFHIYLHGLDISSTIPWSQHPKALQLASTVLGESSSVEWPQTLESLWSVSSHHKSDKRERSKIKTSFVLTPKNRAKRIIKKKSPIAPPGTWESSVPLHPYLGPTFILCSKMEKIRSTPMLSPTHGTLWPLGLNMPTSSS